jgi:hypothetical protein
MACYGGGMTRLVTESSGVTCIQGGEEMMLIRENGNEVRGRGDSSERASGALEMGMFGWWLEHWACEGEW